MCAGRSLPAPRNWPDYFFPSAVVPVLSRPFFHVYSLPICVTSSTMHITIIWNGWLRWGSLPYYSWRVLLCYFVSAAGRWRASRARPVTQATLFRLAQASVSFFSPCTALSTSIFVFPPIKYFSHFGRGYFFGPAGVNSCRLKAALRRTRIRHRGSSLWVCERRRLG